MRCSLPVAPFGISAMNSTLRGTLKSASREAANSRGSDFLATPVSGNPKVIAAGKLTVAVSGPREVFESVEPVLRVFGRGVVDDKAGIAVHLAVLRAFGGRPPVGLTLFVEGEEEIGSPSLPALLASQADALASDAFVITDSANWAVGRPAFTVSLRGLSRSWGRVSQAG